MSVQKESSSKMYSEMFEEFNIPEEHRGSDHYRIVYGLDGEPYPMPTQISIYSPDNIYDLLSDGTAISTEARIEGIEDTTIGARSLIESGAKIGLWAIIGSGCRIGPNAILERSSQLGDEVVIEEKAHIHIGTFIGSKSRISKHVKVLGRSYVGPATMMEEGVTIASDVHIGYGCVIGEGASLGTKSELESQVTVKNHAQIGEKTKIGAGSTVAEDAKVREGRKIRPKTYVYPRGFKHRIEGNTTAYRR